MWLPKGVCHHVLGDGATHGGTPKDESRQRTMRRILLLVTVALVMAAMMVAMAMPVLADSPWTDAQGTCTTKQGKPGLEHSRDTNKDKTKCFVTPEQFKHRQ
jgi:hypothetical protein